MGAILPFYLAVLPGCCPSTTWFAAGSTDVSGS